MLPDRIGRLPCWRGVPSGLPLSGGLSNEIWKITDDSGDHVVRLGADYPCHHVDRARELMTTRAAHAAGFSPAVEYAEKGVMVTQFIPSRTWGPDDVCAHPDRAAHLLRDFHARMPEHVSGPAYLFWVFHVIRDYTRTLRSVSSPHLATLPPWLERARAWEDAQVALPIVFGHNDMLPANILDDGARLWLIDYEYAGFSTALFDLAGVASNSGMDTAHSRALLQAYFGSAPAENLIRAFDAMQCASLLRETMWAMVSQHFLAAPGVDYAAYAAENLGRLQVASDAWNRLHAKDTP